MGAVRLALAILACAFVALIVWAIPAAPIGKSFGAMVADPWGLVALVDLYLGFVLASIVIGLVERAPVRAAGWIVPLYFLGNAWLAVWLIVRLPRLVSLTSRSNAPLP
ncbi:MAG: hypothetical protein AAGF59_08770 [Pseudomonadota bacterium]